MEVYNRLRNKKGELTTQHIVILIVLIMSFAVILFFLFRLNLGEESEKEICRNSVITRGSGALPAGSVPLNCQREYVCVSADGSCENLVQPRIEKVKTVDEIYGVLANEMADCWWIFGEGKVDYIGDKVLKENYCSICSQIAFDNSVKEIEGLEGGEISKDRLYEYLEKEKISDEKTYLEYLFRTNDLNLLKSQIVGDEENLAGVSTFGDISLDEQYFSVMGITSEIGNTYKWIGGGLVVLAFATPVGWVAGAVIVVTGAGAAIIGDDAASLLESEIVGITVQGDGIENQFLAPTIVEAESDQFKLLNCADITTIA